MPWTLYRYILRELLKLLGLTTVVLVVVMSFAAAFKPMSDGLLTPGLLVKFVVFTAPTVLGLALPFAGAFASTLTFLRLSNDNEITACSASGISYLRLLAPVLALGLVLTVGLLLLSNHLVPQFFRLAERTATRDVVGLMASQLKGQETFVAKGMNPGSSKSFAIYADETVRNPLPLIQNPADRIVNDIVLRGVAVGEIDADNRIGWEATAQRARIRVRELAETRELWLKLDLNEAVTNDRGYMGTLKFKWMKIPSSTSDDVSFFSAPQLAALEKQPESFDDVREKMDDLAGALATESVRHALAVTRERVVLNTGVMSARYLLRAARVEDGGELVQLTGGVELAYFADGDTSVTPDRLYRAPRAEAKVSTSRFNPEPSIDLTLFDATVVGDGDAGAPEVAQKRLALRELAWPSRILSDDLANQSISQLMTKASEPVFAGSTAVGRQVGDLRGTVARLHRGIKAERNRRAASSVSCAMLIVLGAVLSIRLRGQTPLTVYFWSFLLAIVSLVVVSTGMNVSKAIDSPLWVGLGVLWSGNALLLVVVVRSYLKIVRH